MEKLKEEVSVYVMFYIVGGWRTLSIKLQLIYFQQAHKIASTFMCLFVYTWQICFTE